MSSDGTAEAIKKEFPLVNVLLGDGNLFWCRGMILAWTYASKCKDYDFYIWLNDDVMLFQTAISTMIRCSVIEKRAAIISGAFRSELENAPTYGGIVHGELMVPDGHKRELDLLNGNCVVVPRAVFEKIGMLDSSFHHGMGDHDYGLRAKKAGVRVLMTPEYVGYCERHDTELLECYDSRYSLVSRVRFLYSPAGPNPVVNARFFWRHYSILETVRFLVTTNLVTVFPCLLGLRRKWIRFVDGLKPKL
jgi:GT2 family glycosyltransferase